MGGRNRYFNDSHLLGSSIVQLPGYSTKNVNIIVPNCNLYVYEETERRESDESPFSPFFFFL